MVTRVNLFITIKKVSTKIHQKFPQKFTKKMSSRIYQKKNLPTLYTKIQFTFYVHKKSATQFFSRLLNSKISSLHFVREMLIYQLHVGAAFTVTKAQWDLELKRCMYANTFFRKTLRAKNTYIMHTIAILFLEVHFFLTR